MFISLGDFLVRDREEMHHALLEIQDITIIMANNGPNFNNSFRKKATKDNCVF